MADLSDTSESVERLQTGIWRSMSPAEKLRLVGEMTETALTFCRAGIRSRHPEASEREVQLRLALILLGPELTAKAYPEAVGLLGLHL